MSHKFSPELGMDGSVGMSIKNQAMLTFSFPPAHGKRKDEARGVTVVKWLWAIFPAKKKKDIRQG